MRRATRCVTKPPPRTWAASKQRASFGRALYTESYRRGWSRAIHKVVLADGQHYNWSITQEYFPEATQIVDLCHARQHVWELGAKLYPSDKAAKVGWIK